MALLGHKLIKIEGGTQIKVYFAEFSLQCQFSSHYFISYFIV